MNKLGQPTHSRTILLLEGPWSTGYPGFRLDMMSMSHLEISSCASHHFLRFVRMTTVFGTADDVGGSIYLADDVDMDGGLSSLTHGVHDMETATKTIANVPQRFSSSQSFTFFLIWKPVARKVAQT